MDLPVTMQAIGAESKQLDRAQTTLELFKLGKNLQNPLRSSQGDIQKDH